MLDVNLAGEQSFPIADVLRERGIPFLFATNYGVKGITPAYQSTPTLQKPYPPEALGAMVAKILGSDDHSPSVGL